MLDRVRAYRRQRFDAGYGAIALPTELGGAGLSPRYVVAFTAEEQGFEAPTSTELISVTTGLVGPTIATFGTDEQREKYARAFLRSDLLCCQLFSEPGRRFRPRRRGDDRRAGGRRLAASTARRCGRPAPASPTTACCSPGPIRTSPSRPG